VFRQFDVAARGEAIKAMLAVAKIPFEEEIIDWSDWLKIRHDRNQFPHGTLPVMRCGDVIFGDSFSSLAFAAKAGGFVPEDPVLYGLCAEVQECNENIYTSYNETSFMDTMREEDPEKKKLLRAKWTETIRLFLGIVNSIAARNTLHPQFIAGSTLTFADFIVYNTICHLNCGDIDFFDPSFLSVEFPRLVAVKDCVFDHPEIAARRANCKGWQK
jgi:glutathione S-transferase